RLATGLRGSRRAEANRFERMYPNATVEELSLRSTPALQAGAPDRDHDRLKALFETWALATASKLADPLVLGEDRRAFHRALAFADRLGLEAIGVTADGGETLVACEVFEILELVVDSADLGSPPCRRWAVSHFQKIDRRIAGVSSFLNQAV